MTPNKYIDAVTGMEVRSGGRNSNLELYRVVVMLAIIAHHYVVNSGLTQRMYDHPGSNSALFLYLLGAWGKTGINCFVMISGYFMCKSKITLKKFAKLLLELQFYRILFSVIFWTTGYEKFTLAGLRTIIFPTLTVQSNFSGSYLIFYLLIPFINQLIQGLSEKKHLFLIILLLAVYTGLASMPWASVTINYVTWFAVLYVVAAYIRLHPKNIYFNCSFWGVMTVLSFGISVASILLRLDRQYTSKVYFYLADSNKILAFTNGLASFMFFKNIKVKDSKIINAMGATTYGVLLIHANSDSMRKWLWQDVLKNTAQFGSSKLVVHAIVSVIVIFAVCSCIDWLRIYFLEKPFFRFWDKRYEKFLSGYQRIEQKVLRLLQIEE